MSSSFQRLATLVLIVLVCGYVRFSANADEERDTTLRQNMPIALLDVGRVFKRSTSFKAELERIQEGVREAQVQFKKENDALAVIVGELNQLKPGTKDHADLQQQISTEQAKLKAKVERQKAKTLSEEAAIYASHYKRIRRVVEDYAREHELRLVLRQNTSQVDADNPQSVLNAVNRFVVFEDRLDITDDIIRLLEE